MTKGALAAEAMNRARREPTLSTRSAVRGAHHGLYAPSNDPHGPLAKHFASLDQQNSADRARARGGARLNDYGIRNLVSDEVAFQVAESVYEYQAYLHGGWRHLDEVIGEEFLPSCS